MTARSDGARVQKGDVVRLAAGGEPMTAIDIRTSCDGTGGDGAGVLCSWREPGDIPAFNTEVTSRLSESSLKVIEAPKGQKAVCYCGDWKDNHESDYGRCRLCMSSRAPWDNCGGFRFWKWEGS